MRFHVFVAVALLTATASGLDAQARRLTYVRDTSVNPAKDGIRRAVTALVRKDGYIVVAPQYFYGGDVIAYDSSGKKQAWTFSLGRGPGAEIGWVNNWGWSGDSVWVVDPGYEQIALIGSDGKVARSIRYPSWVRPFWRDRRKYPLFSRMQWYGMYSDSSLLVEPFEVRRLFDTPDYDPDEKLLLRVDRDGRILKTVARTPAMQGRLLLRSGTERKSINVPSYARTLSATSSDAERVAIVAPIPGDSGAFRVILLTAQGDTVYSRRHTFETTRVSQTTIEAVLRPMKAFGRYTVDQVRDTVRKLVPVFNAPVGGIQVGLDYSVWLAVRRAQTNIRDTEWMVIDGTGDLVGVAVLPRNFRLLGASVDRIWTIETDRAKQASLVVRYRRADATAARPVRSATSSGSSTPSRPRE